MSIRYNGKSIKNDKVLIYYFRRIYICREGFVDSAVVVFFPFLSKRCAVFGRDVDQFPVSRILLLSPMR